MPSVESRVATTVTCLFRSGNKEALTLLLGVPLGLKQSLSELRRDRGAHTHTHTHVLRHWASVKRTLI